VISRIICIRGNWGEAMTQIVLTADRSLMSDYGGGLFVGFAACAPKLIPEWLYKPLLCPPIPEHGGIAKFAPCGTRKMEAALLEKGFDVTVAHPEHLHKVIDEETKAVGITANDPLGLGPASSTFSGLVGKETYSALFYRKLITNSSIRGNTAKVIAGGPGAWQLADERIAAKLGIDCVVVGEGEITAVEMFERVLKGEELPRVVEGEVVPLEQIPSIRNPTICGLVEIARGCGRGCDFCIPTLLKLRCRPIDKILEEIKVNLDAGLDGILLHSEDVLRYGAKGVIPDEGKVLRLYEEVKKLTGWGAHLSHFAFASVMAKPGLIKRLTELMEVPNEKLPWLTGQVGMETGSPEIVRKHMRGKAAPFKPEEWPEVVVEAHKLLAENRWVPCSTLIIGLPGETADDVAKTIELIERLREFRSLIVPLFFVPIGGLKTEKFFEVKDLRPEHWQLMAICIHHNFKWVDDLADDYFQNHRLQGAVVKGVVLRAIKRAVKPHLKLMEQGINPLHPQPDEN